MNILWVLGMYFEISSELITLGCQINQHEGIGWEIATIIQMADNRSTPWMCLPFPPRLSIKWPKSSAEQIPPKSRQIHNPLIPLLFPNIVHFFYLYLYTLCPNPWSSSFHQMERYNLLLSFSSFWTERPSTQLWGNNFRPSPNILHSLLLLLYYYYMLLLFFYYYSPPSHIPYSNQVNGNKNVFTILNVSFNSAFFFPSKKL